MTADEAAVAQRAQELRRAFDRSFAEPRELDTTPLVDLLEIRVGERPYMLYRREIAGLFADRAVTALPSRDPDLMGIAGFPGAIIPVYDLCRFLGYPASERPRWLVLSAGDARVGLAFAKLERYVSLRPEAIASSGGAASTVRHVEEIAQTPAGVLPVIRLSSVVEAIRERARPGVPPQQE